MDLPPAKIHTAWREVAGPPTRQRSRNFIVAGAGKNIALREAEFSVPFLPWQMEGGIILQDDLPVG
ncbi:MAG: hypothetical protein Q4Q03_01115 [Bowdeniella nasicola]|nr:hypothetical protein [Bowdeniella nasicola]